MPTRLLGAGLLLVAIQAQQTPVFRLRTDLARLDVTVIDNRTGRPVTDLSARDFVIREDNIPQDITLFVNEPFVAAPVPDAPQSVVRGGTSDARGRRVFLFYPTMYGALEEAGVRGPVKPLEGMIHFIRERLLPQDLVGVIAFNRVSDLTTDHDYVAQIVERLRKEYQTISYEMLLHGLNNQYQCLEMPAATQARIDGLFQSGTPNDHTSRSVVPFLIGRQELGGVERHLRCGGNWNWRAAGNSLLGVYAGIEYLRSVTGQKHLVALTSQGFVLPFYVRTTYGLFFRDTTDEARLATRANDAGVTIDVIDTAGTQPFGYFVPLSRLSNKNLAFVAGGQFASLRSATDALQRLDASSRHSYLIGYMPSSPALDGKYRKVDVKVNRQDVTVTYRRGYTARAEPPPLDLRVVDIMTRLREAAASDTHQTDLKVTAEAAVVSANPKDGQVRVTATIDGSRIAFTRTGALREGAIDVLILCGDKNQNVVGKIQHQLSMSLDEQKYQRAITDGMPYSVTIPVTGATTYVKVVVYDYESDRLGTAVVKLR